MSSKRTSRCSHPQRSAQQKIAQNGIKRFEIKLAEIIYLPFLGGNPLILTQISRYSTTQSPNCLDQQPLTSILNVRKKMQSTPAPQPLTG